MKKQYSKPEIEFQSFSLSTRIAGDCERKVGNPSKGTCGIPGSAPGLDLFSETVDGCGIHSSTDENDGFCYHVPITESTLFNS